MKFSNIPDAVLDARERAKKNAGIAVIAEINYPASERECQLFCKLGRYNSEHTTWLVHKRTKSKFGTRNVCESYW